MSFKDFFPFWAILVEGRNFEEHLHEINLNLGQ